MFTPALVRVLSASLADDPFYASLVRTVSPECRLQTLDTYFTLAAIEARTTGKSYMTDDRATGIAIWAFREDNAATQARLEALEELLDTAAYARFRQAVDFMAEKVPADLAQAGYLSILGVDPKLRGQGHGAALVQRGVDDMRAEGRNAFLETFNERSVPFYERLGFKVRSEIKEPTLGATYWLMATQAG